MSDLKDIQNDLVRMALSVSRIRSGLSVEDEFKKVSELLLRARSHCEKIKTSNRLTVQLHQNKCKEVRRLKQTIREKEKSISELKTKAMNKNLCEIQIEKLKENNNRLIDEIRRKEKIISSRREDEDRSTMFKSMFKSIIVDRFGADIYIEMCDQANTLVKANK